MIHGLDTGFMVATELSEHPANASARRQLATLIDFGDQIAISPQVLSEFIHVVTDPRRFAHPLTTIAAIDRATQWWTAGNVVPVFPNTLATQRFVVWLRQYSLGRKRLLDTLLAATFWEAGVSSILTTNPADFTIFGCFNCLTP